jgi:hypothetical protein
VTVDSLKQEREPATSLDMCLCLNTSKHFTIFISSSPRYLWTDITMKFQLKEFMSALWSSGQTFWLQAQRSQVRLPALKDFRVAANLERVHSALVRINEDLLERKVAAPV